MKPKWIDNSDDQQWRVVHSSSNRNGDTQPRRSEPYANLFDLGPF